MLDPSGAPKVYDMHGATTGNPNFLAGDRHVGRGVLIAMDRSIGIPEGFLNRGIREQYLFGNGNFNPIRDLDVKYRTMTKDGVKYPIEYDAFNEIVRSAARKLNVTPAEMQSTMRNMYGFQTGNRSKFRTLVEDLNDLSDITGQTLGIPPIDALMKIIIDKIPFSNINNSNRSYAFGQLPDTTGYS